MNTSYEHSTPYSKRGKPAKEVVPTIAPTGQATETIDSMNYAEQFSEYDIAELLEMSRIYEDLNTDEFSPNIRLQVKLEMMYVTMRLCTKEKYNCFDDYSVYVDKVIDRISEVGFKGLSTIEQLFLPAYAFCLRVLEEE